MRSACSLVGCTCRHLCLPPWTSHSELRGQQKPAGGRAPWQHTLRSARCVCAPAFGQHTPPLCGQPTSFSVSLLFLQHVLPPGHAQPPAPAGMSCKRLASCTLGSCRKQNGGNCSSCIPPAPGEGYEGGHRRQARTRAPAPAPHRPAPWPPAQAPSSHAWANAHARARGADLCADGRSRQQRQQREQRAPHLSSLRDVP